MVDGLSVVSGEKGLNPRSEIRDPKEIRSPKSESSDFGLLWGFGFHHPSALNSHLPLSQLVFTRSHSQKGEEGGVTVEDSVGPIGCKRLGTGSGLRPGGPRGLGMVHYLPHIDFFRFACGCMSQASKSGGLSWGICAKA